jgi:hypothetical protein
MSVWLVILIFLIGVDVALSSSRLRRVEKKLDEVAESLT